MRSGSLALLGVLVRVMCREDKHAHEAKIKASLGKFISRSVVW